MRIAIVTLPRTGGTAYGSWLAKELGFSFICEPYWQNKKRITYYSEHEIWEKDNTVTKWILDEFEQFKLDIETVLDSYDFVIIHHRENSLDEAKSFVYALQNFNTIEWHRKYIRESGWETNNQEEINQHFEHFESQKKKLLDLKSDISTTYEGLYYGKDMEKVTKMLNIVPKYSDLLDTKRKYFVEGKKHNTFI